MVSRLDPGRLAGTLDSAGTSDGQNGRLSEIFVSNGQYTRTFADWVNKLNFYKSRRPGRPSLQVQLASWNSLLATCKRRM